MIVEVGPLPGWIDPVRLLGEGPWTGRDGRFSAELSPEAAADLEARLHGVVLAGKKLDFRAEPPLRRPRVRAARAEEARRRRDTTPGLLRPGTRVDEEGRWSLTPEPIALAVGRRAGRRAVIDACCGVGGDAIGFARAGARVIAVDVDAGRLEMARHNASVYGVSIDFRHGRAEALVPELPGDLVYVDPPWGPDYRGPTALSDLPVLAAVLAARGGRELWAKVPPSFDPESVPGAVPEAVFGAARGDARRVKFVLLRVP